MPQQLRRAYERRPAMTIASCGSVSATTLGLPNSTAIPAEKARLPERPVRGEDSGFRQNKSSDWRTTSNQSPCCRCCRRATRSLPPVRACRNTGDRPAFARTNAAVPTDIVELIAMQRKSGMLFVCVRDADFEGTTRQECAFAVRRALPARAGHTTTSKVFASDWQPAGERPR